METNQIHKTTSRKNLPQDIMADIDIVSGYA